MTIDVGDDFPDFSLETNGGGRLSKSELEGTVYVVFLYPKDDTSGCTKEAIGFTEAKADFDSLGVQILGCSKDPVASHDKFIDKHNLGMTLLSDPDGKLIEAVGSWVEKSMYGRKYMGIDRSTFLVDGQGRVAAVWRKVKVTNHVKAVLKAAKELTA